MGEQTEYRGVSLKKPLVDDVESFIKKTKTYSSIAEFVSEAIRLRLETLRNNIKNGVD